MDAGRNDPVYRIELLLDCYENTAERRSIQSSKGIDLTQEKLAEKINTYYNYYSEKLKNDASLKERIDHIKKRIDHMNNATSISRVFASSTSRSLNSLEKDMISDDKKGRLHIRVFLPNTDLNKISLTVLKQFFEKTRAEIVVNDKLKGAIDKRMIDMTTVAEELFPTRKETEEPSVPSYALCEFGKFFKENPLTEYNLYTFLERIETPLSAEEYQSILRIISSYPDNDHIINILNLCNVDKTMIDMTRVNEELLPARKDTDTRTEEPSAPPYELYEFNMFFKEKPLTEYNLYTFLNGLETPLSAEGYESILRIISSYPEHDNLINILKLCNIDKRMIDMTRVAEHLFPTRKDTDT